MAVQFHVAHSSLVSGAGSVAGPPYNCAGGLSLMASTVCMNGLGIISLSSIYKSVSSAYEAGLIDNPANLKNSNVYIYSGLLDIVVATSKFLFIFHSLSIKLFERFKDTMALCL